MADWRWVIYFCKTCHRQFQTHEDWGWGATFSEALLFRGSHGPKCGYCGETDPDLSVA